MRDRHPVVLSERVRGTGGAPFLSKGEVNRAWDLPLKEESVHPLLERPNDDHRPKEIDGPRHRIDGDLDRTVEINLIRTGLDGDHGQQITTPVYPCLGSRRPARIPGTMGDRGGKETGARRAVGKSGGR